MLDFVLKVLDFAGQPRRNIIGQVMYDKVRLSGMFDTKSIIFLV